MACKVRLGEVVRLDGYGFREAGVWPWVGGLCIKKGGVHQGGSRVAYKGGKGYIY